jgi:hypothetical protein
MNLSPLFFFINSRFYDVLDVAKSIYIGKWYYFLLGGLPYFIEGRFRYQNTECAECISFSCCPRGI